MAKVIKYNLCTEGNEENLIPVEMGWNEVNETIAKREAYNGEYTIEDDGVEVVHTPTAQEDTDAMLVDHEYRLTMLELFTDVTI